MQPFEQSPYWKTLQPIIENGAIQAAIDGVYKYPYRINLYPGISCMFECLYCGRNYDAVIKKSENVYKQIIEQDDGKDKNRFGITGGLEPLTSPYINNICKDLIDKGYKSRMVTNGFLLNDKIISKNPYINSLDHLRISLYGLDNEEYVATTRHKLGWKVVKENLTNYNKRDDKTKLFLNYVLLPKHFENLHSIINYIQDIGGASNLSLREDYTFQYKINERNRVQDTLLAFDERIKKMNMTIDYGYALQNAMRGEDTHLMRVTYNELRPKQSPQVKICVVPNGNIYSYMSAGFVERPGALRHALGNVNNSSIEQELKKQVEVTPRDDDMQYLDAYNHLILKYIHEQSS